MKKTIKILGTIILIVCLFFIVRTLINFDIDYKIFLDIKLLGLIVGLAVLHSVSVYINSVSWFNILKNISHQKIVFSDIYNVYARANIGKYLPGNIMHFAGRNIIGTKYKISQKNMSISTGLEITLKLFCACLIIMVMGYNNLSYVIEIVNTNNISIELFWVLATAGGLILVFLLIYYFYPKPGISIKFKENLKTLIRVNFFYCLIFIINIFVFIIITNHISSNSLNIQTIMFISSIYLISWFVGYLTPGSPGGIGVREAILILILTPVIGGELIVIVSILVRIVNILSDVIVFLTNKIVSIINSKHKDKSRIHSPEH